MPKSHRVYNLLIIDDEPSICAGCRMVLAQRGYSADTRNTGKAGLDALLSGRYLLVLLESELFGHIGENSGIQGEHRKNREAFCVSVAVSVNIPND